MSVLRSKHILLIGDENNQLNTLESKLQSHGMISHKTTCEGLSFERIKELGVDVAIVNHLHGDELCKNVFDKLKPAQDDNSLLPVLVQVNGSDEEIQDALIQGAADYITPGEDDSLVVSKIQAVLGQSNDFSTVSVIDISPTEASTTATGVKVYVVEDDPLLRNLLSVKLQKSSFPYEFSDTGENIIEKIKTFNPDVIILDLMLPVKDGFEVLTEIKSEELLKNKPVIVFSNRDGQEDRQRVKELGANKFFVKAMTDLSELIEVIESLAKK